MTFHPFRGFISNPSVPSEKQDGRTKHPEIESEQQPKGKRHRLLRAGWSAARPNDSAAALLLFRVPYRPQKRSAATSVTTVPALILLVRMGS